MRLLGLLAIAAPVMLAAQDTVVASPRLVWPRRPGYEILLLLPRQPIPVGRTTWGHAQLFDSVSHRLRLPVRWTSSDSTILSVAASGDSAVPIRGRRVGRVIVTVSSGPAVASEIVYVGRLPLARRLAVIPRRAELHVGDDIRLMADPRDASGRRLPGTFLMWAWSDSSIVRLVGMPVPLEVVFHAVAPGDVTVFAKLDGRTGEARLHVEP